MGLAEIRRLKAEAELPKPKKEYRIPKVGKKKAEQIARAKAAGTDGEMNLFFSSMRKSMKGRCLFCGNKTMKDDDKKFHYSLAHLLPKSIFPSVATNRDNVIELCFYEKSCHTNFDSGMITWEVLKDSKEWETLKERLFNILPQVAHEERKHKLYSKLESLVYNLK